MGLLRAPQCLKGKIRDTLYATTSPRVISVPDVSTLSQTEIAGAAEEIALPAGRITPGVVRIGETVRRPAKASSSFVAELLAHLEARGCSWAPRYRGRDASGRDVLSYLAGSVPAKWQTFADHQLRAAAAIVRALHDATAGSKLAPVGVVCHHDPGPNNFVFRDQLPVALIDFDTAAAGSPLEDLGYMVWAWCLSSNPLRGQFVAQARQVRVLLDAYGAGAAERAQLPEAISERLQRNVQFWCDRLEDPGAILTAREKLPELVAWSKAEQQYIAAHRAELVAALR